MINKPLVSVIIPMFNVEAFILQTLNSVITQSWKNLEIIVVDDGSTDRSAEIVRSIKDERIRMFFQINSGAAAARNYGLKNASGEFIQYLDGDDLLSADKIEQQLLLLINNKDKVAVCSTIYFYENELIQNLKPNPYEESFLQNSDHPDVFLINLWGGYANYGSMVTIHAWLTPVNLIDIAGPWKTNLSYDDDGEYFARILLNSKGVLKSEHGYSYYRKQAEITISDLNSEAKLKSMLEAMLSKKKELLARNQSYEANLAIFKGLLDVCVKTFPKYLTLYNKAIHEMPNIEVTNYTPSIGGPTIQKITKIFGWQIARLLQFIIKRK